MLVANAFLVLLAILIPAQSAGGHDEADLDAARFDGLFDLLPTLVSEDDRERLVAAARFREKLDAESACELVLRLDRFDLPLRAAVIDVLSGGGPWMPGVLDALRRDPKTLDHARIIIRGALGQRPVDEDPPPLLDAMRVFPEGLRLDFMGTWPGPVPLADFLDHVNFTVRPACAFALSPELAGKAVVYERPLSGPAQVVLDFELQQRGLGLRLLESAVLVTPEGGGSRDLAASEQEFDTVLLDRIIDVIADPGADRRKLQAAMRALACLDPPGFFEGYYRLLRASSRVRDGSRGDPSTALDYLFSAGPCFRLATRLGMDRDAGIAAFLMCTWEDAPQGSRRKELARLILLLPADLREEALARKEAGGEAAELLFRGSWGEEDPTGRITACLQSGDEMLESAAMRAAALLLPHRPRLHRELIAVFADIAEISVAAAADLDRCLVILGESGGDELLAGLFHDGALPAAEGRLPRGAYEAAAAFGKHRCRDALAQRLEKESLSGAERRDSLLAVREIDRRLKRDPVAVDENGIREALLEGGDEAIPAAALLAFCAPERIVDIAGPALKAAGGSPPGYLRAALIEAAVRLNRLNRTASERIRLDLKNYLRPSMDPVLNRALRTLAETDYRRSYRLEIRF